MNGKVGLNGISHIRYVENMHRKKALESELKTNVPDFFASLKSLTCRF